MKTKEYGSNFHFETFKDYLIKKEQSFYFNNSLSLFLSGRAALFRLIEMGVKNLNWKRVYVPSYYCHEVITPLKDLDIIINYYNINPFENDVVLENIENSQTSAFVNVNYFGVYQFDTSSLDKLFIIEDLTYCNSALINSQAHYCFGSIRKELPVTVGGFCASPKNLELPYNKETNYGNRAHKERLLAMSLKTHFLQAGFGSKTYFLELFTQSEALLDNSKALCGIPSSAKDLLFSIDYKTILKQKQRNLKAALSNLAISKGVTVNLSNKFEGFGLIFYFDLPEKRERVRLFLIQNKIYPAILWPNQISKFAQNIEGKVLFVHVDYRYDLSDIDYIVDSINQSFYE